MSGGAPFSPILWKVAWRYVARHFRQSLLMIVGIAVGVAVVVAVDLANASAGRAFELSTQAIAGKATQQISGGTQGLPDGLYAELRRAFPTVPMTPVVEAYVSSPQLGERPLQLLGIDPFSEAAFYTYLGKAEGFSTDQLAAFLTRPGALFLSAQLAGRYGLAAGDTFSLEVGGVERSVFIAGLLHPSDALAQQTLEGTLLADISTAQELTGRNGKLERIDLILPPGDKQTAAQISARLPQGALLTTAAASGGALEQMTAAFRTNLTALSLLALVVGLFLIYNTMTFSVVQRRALFGALRCLGVTRREIFLLVAGEALLVGVLGSGLGIGLGIFLGQFTVRMVTQTINDLYFVTTVTSTGIAPLSLVKGAALGILATVLTAIPPAIEAAAAPPSLALSRSGLESKARRALPWTAAGGLAAFAVAGGIFALPTNSLPAGFLGTFAVVLGFALLSAITLFGLARAVTPLSGRLFGAFGRMAPRNLVSSLSRTSVAVAALMVAVAVTIGVGLMVASFRYTVEVWLAQTLQGDVYITAPSFTAVQAGPPIDPGVVQALQGWPGVARVDLLRSATVESPSGPVEVSATSNPAIGQERLYLRRSGSPQQVWEAMQAGGVIVSEPLANRLGLPSQGGSLRLYTPQGARDFPVAGVYYDYSSSQGEAMLAMDVYQRIWQDTAVTSIALRLAPGTQASQVVSSLQDQLPGRQSLVIRSNQALRQDVMAVFDRTFAITGALQLLATGVAFIGVLGALLLLQLEKQREIGILRAIGLTARQLWGLTMLETGLMGLVAGLLAMPTGYALSLILIYIINRRSFGWTLQMALQPGPFLQALAVAVIAALLAGIYPARKLGKMITAEAIRFE